MHDEPDRVVGIERMKYGGVGSYVHDAENSEHQKPNQHERAKPSPDGRCARALSQKYKRYDCEYNRHYGGAWIDVTQAFYRRSDGECWRYDTVGQQCACPDGSHYVKPFVWQFAHK